jgi:hypothetical protein
MKPVRQQPRPRKNRQEAAVKPPAMNYGYSGKRLEDLLERGALS